MLSDLRPAKAKVWSQKKTEMRYVRWKSFLVFLTIMISLFDGQIFDYKQLALDTKIGDPSKDQ